MRLVLIEWIDSFGCGTAWEPTGDVKEPKPIICKSVGWLAVDGETYKIVIPHTHPSDEDIGAEASGCGDMAIPTACVMRLVDLVEAQ